jgi:hypothetical protein
MRRRSWGADKCRRKAAEKVERPLDLPGFSLASQYPSCSRSSAFSNYFKRPNLMRIMDAVYRCCVFRIAGQTAGLPPRASIGFVLTPSGQHGGETRHHFNLGITPALTIDTAAALRPLRAEINGTTCTSQTRLVTPA